jgi:hypothetical protein
MFCDGLVGVIFGASAAKRFALPIRKAQTLQSAM